MVGSQDNLYLTYSRILVGLYILRGFVTCQYSYLIASCDVGRARGRQRLLNRKHLFVLLAEPISDTSIQYMDFVEIFNVSLDLSTV